MLVLSHSRFFSRIFPLEASLILRVLPRYIGCHYYLTILFSADGLVIYLHFYFPKVGIATHLCFYYVDWPSLPNYLFTFSWIGTTTQLLINFLKVWHCHPIAILFCGLALPPNCYFILWIGLAFKLLLTITVGWKRHPNITSCNIPLVTHKPNNRYQSMV